MDWDLDVSTISKRESILQNQTHRNENRNCLLKCNTSSNKGPSFSESYLINNLIFNVEFTPKSPI